MSRNARNFILISRSGVLGPRDSISDDLMSQPEVVEKMITAKLKYDENIQEAKKFKKGEWCCSFSFFCKFKICNKTQELNL